MHLADFKLRYWFSNAIFNGLVYICSDVLQIAEFWKRLHWENEEELFAFSLKLADVSKMWDSRKNQLYGALAVLLLRT